jgi:hypothetical protein
MSIVDAFANLFLAWHLFSSWFAAHKRALSNEIFVAAKRIFIVMSGSASQSRRKA